LKGDGDPSELIPKPFGFGDEFWAMLMDLGSGDISSSSDYAGAPPSSSVIIYLRDSFTS